LGCAIASRFLASDLQDGIIISGMFLCGALAAALLGPAAAFAIPAITVLVDWTIDRYRRPVIILNIASAVLPTVLGAAALRALGLDHDNLGFYLALAVVTFL